MNGEVGFDSDVVIITGGAGGIGRSQAIELGRRGARVLVNDLGGSPRGGGSDPTMAQAVVDEIISAGGGAVASGASVSSDEGPQQIVDAALDTWGSVFTPDRRRSPSSTSTGCRQSWAGSGPSASRARYTGSGSRASRISPVT